MYQNTLRKVELPIVDNNYCEQLLRTTRLGPYFGLYGTFICAGGETNKDTCQGDGGAALICPLSATQYVQVNSKFNFIIKSLIMLYLFSTWNYLHKYSKAFLQNFCSFKVPLSILYFVK